MAFSTRLPDPAYKRHFSGKNEGLSNAGDYGPGFASVKLTSDQKVMMSRTNSQRVLSRAVAGQKWKIDIDYHPMTQAEFRPVAAFLQMKQGSITPFQVALPQYNTPVNTEWVDFLALAADDDVSFVPTTTTLVGAMSILIECNDVTNPAYNGTTDGNIPQPGEMFSITDSNHSNHTKVYMITYVETWNQYHSTASQPDSNDQVRLGISPPLVTEVSTSAVLNFTTPLFKVVMPTAVRSYSLNTDNLYKFSLKLEEFL